MAQDKTGPGLLSSNGLCSLLTVQLSNRPAFKNYELTAKTLFYNELGEGTG